MFAVEVISWLRQLVAETRQPLPPQPGKPERFDYEYERRGTANVFMLVAPRLEWRQVNVTERRTRVDFALQMRLLVDDYFPQAPAICQSRVAHRPLKYSRDPTVPTWGRPVI